MPEFTPRMGLRKDDLSDYSNIRALWQNWDRIDELKGLLDDHTHDNSEIWNEIARIWAYLFNLEQRHNKLELFVSQFYENFLVHNHDGVETVFLENFNDTNQTDTNLSTTWITTSEGILHLPSGYDRNRVYRWVAKPFELRKDPYPDNFERIPDAEEEPTRAYGRIIASHEGDITPYLAITNDPQAGERTGTYLGAKRGTLTAKSLLKDRYSTKHSFDTTIETPHRAWHFTGTEDPPLSAYNRNSLTRDSFNRQEYRDISLRDGKLVTTQEVGRARPVYHQFPQNIEARILYNGERPLAYNQKHNEFYWFDTMNGNFNKIDRKGLSPIWEPGLVEVAATEDPSGYIWVLTTKVEDAGNPRGYFNVFNQVYRWDPVNDEVKSGQRWRAARLAKHHWPRPKVVGPTRLEAFDDRLIVITETNMRQMFTEGKRAVNYYEDSPTTPATINAANYPWLPIQSIYGGSQRKGSSANFALFNPSLLGTVHEIRKDREESWTAEGIARPLFGAYAGIQNRWANLPDNAIGEFDGVNDKLYLGIVGRELIFYQAFCPYNPADPQIADNFDKDNFRDKHRGTEWHGIWRHNYGGGREYTRDIPFRVNVSGAIKEAWGYLAGGTELVRQWVLKDGRRIATRNDIRPSEANYAFWMERNHPRSKTHENIVDQRVYLHPLKFHYEVGKFDRVATAIKDRVMTENHLSQMILNRGGYTVVGGKRIMNRKGVRVRPGDANARRVGRWLSGKTEGSRSSQIYAFAINASSEKLKADDEIYIYYDGFHEGSGTWQPGGSFPPRGVELRIWNNGWELLSRTGENTYQKGIPVRKPDILARRTIWLQARSAGRTDIQNNTPSKLHTDHIYLEVRRQVYAYEYEWSDMPQGDKAALSLECRGRGLVQNSSLGEGFEDSKGVAVENVGLSIISSKGNDAG